MIRRFILGLMALVFSVGCGYYWWQTITLRGQVVTLKQQVATDTAKLKKLEAKHGGASRSAHVSEPVADVALTSDTPDSWLARGNIHSERARVAADHLANDLAIAQAEVKAATDAYNHAASGPVKQLSAARRKMSQIESDMGGYMSKMKSAVSQ